MTRAVFPADVGTINNARWAESLKLGAAGSCVFLVFFVYFGARLLVLVTDRVDLKLLRRAEELRKFWQTSYLHSFMRVTREGGMRKKKTHMEHAGKLLWPVQNRLSQG